MNLKTLLAASPADPSSPTPEPWAVGVGAFLVIPAFALLALLAAIVLIVMWPLLPWFLAYRRHHQLRAAAAAAAVRPNHKQSHAAPHFPN